MAERVVTIKLIAEATGLVQGFNRAKDAVAETKAKVEESARSNREEWTKVGGALTAVGVAVTGVGVAALKTGIQYNTLQQTTRAALTSLLGSAQAANAQMDKLDDFARNSPFSKATFISAQQQMLAFGIEARKVVPYLDAVQNAVAAAGGSNADIEGIVATMSKIQSSAKITATDLMEFGNRGVNAADLIGSQMGKTGAQIREDITAGTLSAEQALDALAAGMSETYAGAADNVKNTFAGALDRVSAAWRDFSAELATPLVDPNGGGALVDLLNWAADAMRAFEDLPGPVKTTTSAIVGVAGASALALGGAMVLIPKLLEMRDAFRLLTAEGGMARSVIGGLGRFFTGPYGVALLAAAAVTTVLVSENQKLSSQARELADTLDESTGSITKNSQAWAANQLQQEGVLSAAKRLGISAKDMTDAWLGNGDALSRVNDRLDKFRNDADFRMENADWRGWSDDLADLDYALNGSNKVLAEAKTRHQELAEATGESGSAASESSAGVNSLSEQYSEASDKAAELSNQLISLLNTMGELNGLGQSAEQTNSALQDSFSKLQEYVANAQAGVEGYSLSLDASTVEGAKNRAMLAAHAADVEKNATAQFELESKTLGATTAAANFEARLSAGRQQIYDTALALTGSADEAQKLTDKILAMPDQKDIDVLLRGAQDAENALNNLARYRETTIGIRYEGEKGVHMRANGGTIGYATGGTIGLAAGGLVPGIGGGIASGTVFGRGTETSDSVLVRLSRGEEVIRASEARKHRGLLKQINAGMYSPGLQASNFAPSAPQTIVVERTVVEHVPASITVKDANNALIGTMAVVADGRIDVSLQQQARANRRAGL